MAQQLSQDPLYILVFQDNFDHIDYGKWRTSWYWGNNMWNSNITITCDSSHFPGRVVDVAYNSQPPYDTNRIIIDSAGINFERMIFDRQDFFGNIIVYHSPCPSIICENHECDTNSAGLTYCYYDSLVPFKFCGAMLLGRNKFKYGYFEMRYKLIDLENASWNAYGPNFWMWSSDSSAKYSEIDIFEQRGTDWRMGMNFHFRKTDPGNSNEWQDTVFWHGIGGGGSAILNSGSFHLAGQDFVLLQSGFEASGTADVIISTTPCQPDQIIVTDSSGSDYSMPDLRVLRDLQKAKIHY